MSRLTDLQAENNQAGIEMMTEAGRFAALADRHNNELKPRAVTAFNLFQTPVEIAEKMVNIIPSYPQKVLEPSAGLGRLYRTTVKKYPDSNYTLVENNPQCAGELYKFTNIKLIQKDFLSIEPAKEGNADLIIKELPHPFYDLIIMNPPFKQGLDIKHILHARKFLTTNGLLIGLCYNGVKQNRILKPLCDKWEVLPKDSFKSEGTRAEVVLIVLTNLN